jgi:hypothetical protein
MAGEINFKEPSTDVNAELNANVNVIPGVSTNRIRNRHCVDMYNYMQ